MSLWSGSSPVVDGLALLNIHPDMDGQGGQLGSHQTQLGCHKKSGERDKDLEEITHFVRLYGPWFVPYMCVCMYVCM